MRPFRCLLTCAMGMLLTGCPGSMIPSKSNESGSTATNSAAPANTAPEGGNPEAAAPAGDPAMEAAPSAAGESGPAPVVAGEGGAAPAAQEPQPKQNAFQRVAELVDRNKFLAEHPNAIEKQENKINANGYAQAISQGYFNIGSRATMANFEYDLRIQKELNDGKWPSFEAYKKVLDTHGVQLKGLRKNQVYAYDDQTGDLTIIEIPEAAQAP